MHRVRTAPTSVTYYDTPVLKITGVTRSALEVLPDWCRTVSFSEINADGPQW